MVNLIMYYRTNQCLANNLLEDACAWFFSGFKGNKAVNTASPVAYGWAGAVLVKVTKAFGQEQ